MGSTGSKYNISIDDRFAGCLLGLACGDAVGTTVEFRARGSFEPMSDMVGGGPFNLQAGQWTDDTSMALCLAASLVECGGFDAADQMKRYVKWRSEGYMSSTGNCFDIGGTVAQALERFVITKNPFSGSDHERSAGNGSLMRLAPVPMYFYPDLQDVLKYSGESSRTTHGAAECIEASRLLGLLLFKAFEGLSKEEVLFSNNELSFECLNVKSIAKGDYRNKSINDIRGSGYVIDSLEAALWCFYSTTSYRDAILKAANLGDDADTTAAICGQISGAFYGVNGIPDSWKNKVAMKEAILKFSSSLERKVNES
jgi:ADP-ribosyl-[dinitrogen reductase] hydrolase